jgi:curved DNA-binding protein CbpA
MSSYTDDPCVALGVPVDADVATVKKAYRKLALLHHPDRAVVTRPYLPGLPRRTKS